MSNATPDGVFGPGWNEVEADMASKAYLVTWLGAACASVIVYEYTITFGAEVEFYWWTKWTIPRVLFFLNRYLVGSIIIFDFIANAIPHLSVPFCKFYLRWLSITVTITTSITEAILTTRVCALYRTHPRLRAFSILCCVLGTTTLVVITIVNYLATGPVDVVTDYPDLPGCQSTDNPFLAIAYWITPLCIESVFFIMVIYQAFGWVRQRQPPPPTLRLLARDSAVYFACICGILFVNLFFYLYGPPLLAAMFVIPSNAVACVASSRLLLNMRALAHHGVFTSDSKHGMHATEISQSESAPWGMRRNTIRSEVTDHSTVYELEKGDTP